MKNNFFIIGGVLLGLLLFLGVSVLLRDKPDTAEPPPLPVETEAPTSSSNLGEEQNVTPAPEVNQADDSLEGILKLVLPSGEQLANEALSEKYLLYARKESNHVYVYSRDLQKGTEILIFDFFEYAEYEGDYRSEPPALSVSPDGTKVAFTDKEGLKVYFLSSGQVAKYIYKVKFETGEWGDEERTPAVWSEAALNISLNHFDSSTVSLSEPRWSYDGNYISFLYSSMIDSGLGAYEIKGGRYFELEWWGAISWSPVENSYILSYAYGGGFYKSVRDDPTNISPLFQDQFAESEIFHSDPGYSADGSKIAFIFSDGYEDTNNVALAKADGSGFVQIATNGLYSNPFFSPDGSLLYYFKQIGDEQVLMVSKLAGGETSKLLIMPDGYTKMFPNDPFNGWFFVDWTTEGYMALRGISNDYEAEEARLIVVDPDSGKIIYAGPSFKGFATFGAFSRATY